MCSSTSEAESVCPYYDYLWREDSLQVASFFFYCSSLERRTLLKNHLEMSNQLDSRRVLAVKKIAQKYAANVQKCRPKYLDPLPYFLVLLTVLLEKWRAPLGYLNSKANGKLLYANACIHMHTRDSRDWNYPVKLKAIILNEVYVKTSRWRRSRIFISESKFEWPNCPLSIFRRKFGTLFCHTGLW